MRMIRIPGQQAVGAGLSLWGLALVGLPFQRLWPPGLERYPQVAELAALPLILAGAILWLRGGRPQASIVDLGFAVWVAGELIAAGFAFTDLGVNGTVAREVLVTLYLAALYASIRVTATRPLLDRFPALYGGSALLAGSLGLLGFLLAVGEVASPLAVPATSHFPYLGHAARAHAFTPNPNMLASILMLASFFTLFAWRASRSHRLLLAIPILVGLFATLSKAVLALGAGMAVAAMISAAGAWKPAARAAAAALATILALAYAVIPHFLLLPESQDRTELERTMLIAGDPYGPIRIAGEPYVLAPTNYLVNKRTSLEAIRASWPYGIGPGRQPEFADSLQRIGRYPKNLWAAAPHSTYLGATAQSGAAGLLGLSALLGSLAYALLRSARKRSVPRSWRVALLGAFVALCVEAVNTDVLHFRHYTWFTAIVATLVAGPLPLIGGERRTGDGNEDRG